MTDLSAWLASLGLERYAATFAENAIDHSLLPTLTADDLKELGVTALGHRKTLLAAIAALAEAPASSPSAPTSPTATPPSSAAERRQLTVMFVDLVGSTALSAQLDPEEMGAVLRGYQNAVAGEIAAVRGPCREVHGRRRARLFRLAGGARGRGGAGGSGRARHPRGRRAAGRLAMRRLACRIGLATGLVVVGELIGEGAAQEQTVVGETPNLAARLQALANPGQLVVADATRRLLGDIFEVAGLGRHAVKGIDRPVEAFAVTGERPAESRFVARSGPDLLPIVGRDQELALLVERWRQALAGEGQLVLLARRGRHRQVADHGRPAGSTGRRAPPQHALPVLALSQRQRALAGDPASRPRRRNRPDRYDGREARQAGSAARRGRGRRERGRTAFGDTARHRRRSPLRAQRPAAPAAPPAHAAGTARPALGPGRATAGAGRHRGRPLGRSRPRSS